MSKGDASGPARVRRLSAYADLPLGSEREQKVADILDAWVIDANALSLKMSAAEHQQLLPVTIFNHPIGSGEDA